ncbi:MAG: hypothetical protein ACJAR1_002506 [Rubritalea sp.]|jgi:hypothetical protein
MNLGNLDEYLLTSSSRAWLNRQLKMRMLKILRFDWLIFLRHRVKQIEG